MNDTRRALEVVLKPQNEVNVERIVNEMKNNALATSNWEQLVASAPVALRCLGACFMAAGSKDLTSVKVPMMPGAKVQRPPYLQANLVRCSNLGTTAFLVANKGMAEIYQKSGLSENKVYDIVEVLGNQRAAAKQLPSLLNQLQAGASQCYDVSKGIDQSFAEWLAFTSELFEACQNQSSVVADEQQNVITNKAVAAQQVQDTEKMVQSTKDAMKELGKTMDTARAAFKRASDNQPTGWDIVGQQLVSSLGQCLTTGLSLAIPALVDNMNPMAKAKTAAGMLGDLKDGKKDTSTQPKDSSGGSNAASKPQTTSTTPQPADPALAYVQKDLYLYNLLKPIIQGANGDVDWQASKASGDKSGLSFIESMLSQSKTDLDKQTSNGIVTAAYKQILNDVTNVVSEMIKAWKDNTSTMNVKLPAKGSEAVVRWQTSFDSSYRSVVSLDLQAKSLPYNSPSSSPAVPDPALEKAKIDAQASQTQAVLQHAAAQLETTARAMETTSKVYGDTQKLLSEQQTNLSNLNATLARLTSSAIKLEESKEILISCIALIVELKARIVDLVNFFGTLAAVIKTVSENLVGNWLDTVKNAVTGGSTDPRAMLRIGQYSLETAERTMILNGSITIAAYFSFFADVANTWRSVSEKSIFPGIQLAESLSVPGDAQEKMAKLDKWSKEAQEHITTEVGKRRQEIQSGMADRVGEVRGLIKDLPANTVPPAIMDVAEKTAGFIENTQKENLKQENDDNAIKIVTGRRRQISAN